MGIKFKMKGMKLCPTSFFLSVMAIALIRNYRFLIDRSSISTTVILQSQRILCTPRVCFCSITAVSLGLQTLRQQRVLSLLSGYSKQNETITAKYHEL